MPPKKAVANVGNKKTGPSPPVSHELTVEKVEDLEKLTVPQLKDFLRPRGVRLGGNRAELLQLARLYFRYAFDKGFNDVRLAD